MNTKLSKDFRARLRALEKAAKQLQRGLWRFDGETLHIHSASGCVWYDVTRYHCPCPARGLCWHRYAWWLVWKEEQRTR